MSKPKNAPKTDFNFYRKMRGSRRRVCLEEAGLYAYMQPTRIKPNKKRAKSKTKCRAKMRPCDHA